MTKYYIAWNEDRSEGFITDDPNDAGFARGDTAAWLHESALAEEFFNLYGEDDLPEVEQIEITRS